MKRIKKQTLNSNSAYLFCLGQVNSEGFPLDYRGNTIKSVCVTVPQILIGNSPVSRKLKYLWNVNDHQLTAVAQHPGAVWRP